MRLRVRVQAERHSVLVMCVPASQKPMHASSVSPPPPGALGANSLGLAVEVVDEKPEVVEEDVELDVVVFTPDEPPLDSISAAGAGESGAIAVAWGAGVPMAEGGSEVVGIVVLWGTVAAAAAAAAAVWDWDGGCWPVCLPPGAVARGVSARDVSVCDVAVRMWPPMPLCPPPPRASAA